MNNTIISKVSGPPGKCCGSSYSFDSFNLFLKYPLFENSGNCKTAKKLSYSGLTDKNSFIFSEEKFFYLVCRLQARILLWKFYFLQQVGLEDLVSHSSHSYLVQVESSVANSNSNGNRQTSLLAPETIISVNIN